MKKFYVNGVFSEIRKSHVTDAAETSLRILNEVGFPNTGNAVRHPLKAPAASVGITSFRYQVRSTVYSYMCNMDRIDRDVMSKRLLLPIR